MYLKNYVNGHKWAHLTAFKEFSGGLHVFSYMGV